MAIHMLRTLVIGATGTLGGEVVAQMALKGKPIRAMSRRPDQACFAPGVQVVAGDLTAPETLDRCLDGIESVFLVWTAPPDAVRPALERILGRVRRIVFLSAPIKTPHPFFQQPNPSRDLAMRGEELIETWRVEWTIRRPGMFCTNARHSW